MWHKMGKVFMRRQQQAAVRITLLLWRSGLLRLARQGHAKATDRLPYRNHLDE